MQENSTAAENNLKEVGDLPESVEFLSMTNSNSRISSMQNQVSQQITFEDINSFDEFNSMHVKCDSNSMKFLYEDNQSSRVPKLKLKIQNTGI